MSRRVAEIRHSQPTLDFDSAPVLGGKPGRSAIVSAYRGGFWCGFACGAIACAVWSVLAVVVMAHG